jgi:hypothetical protein
MAVEVEKTGAAAKCFILKMLTSKAHVVDFAMSYMKRAFHLYAKRKLILTAYLSANRWIAVAILQKRKRVLYFDSLKSLKNNFSLFSLIINE